MRAHSPRERPRLAGASPLARDPTRVAAAFPECGFGALQLRTTVMPQGIDVPADEVYSVSHPEADPESRENQAWPSTSEPRSDSARM